MPNGGSATGDGFEERVPWSALGVPTGTGLYFHIGSSNSANPSNLHQQVDDNMGGLTPPLTFGTPELSSDPSKYVQPNTTCFFVVQSKGGTWDGISAESVARMPAQAA